MMRAFLLTLLLAACDDAVNGAPDLSGVPCQQATSTSCSAGQLCVFPMLLTSSDGGTRDVTGVCADTPGGCSGASACGCFASDPCAEVSQHCDSVSGTDVLCKP